MKKSFFQAIFWLSSLNAVLFLTGCGGARDSAYMPAVLTSISITPTTPSILQGGTQQFTATGRYSDNSTGDVTLDATWTSTNISNATITDAGLATGTGVGASTIEASLGGKTSSTLLTVTASVVAPTITTQPINQSVTEGQAATFSVTASGTAPLTYQWRKNGANVVGANASSYITPVTVMADNGATFSVVVSNASGNVTSADATLTVTASPVAPTITTQPTNKSVTEGQVATFSVTASGTAPMSYQWRKNGANVVGANASSYTTPVTVMADNGATFSVVVSNTSGNVTSNEATLTVTASSSSSYVADYHVATEAALRAIPDSYINAARTTLHVAYFHTSHGTHVSYGAFGLPGFKNGDNIKFGITNNTAADPDKLDFHDYYGQDLSQADADWQAWRDQVRAYLDNPANAAINVMMWSWCDIAGHSVDNYLTSMQTLIDEYGPGGSKIGTGVGKRINPVTFIFMTGHANAYGNLGPGQAHDQAAVITAYCNAHGYFCIDYYSVDTHAMDGTYYDDAGDDGDSASYFASNSTGSGSFYIDWERSHTEGVDWYQNRSEPAPSGFLTTGVHNNQHITANRKAFAFWWVLARIAGY